MDGQPRRRRGPAGSAPRNRPGPRPDRAPRCLHGPGAVPSRTQDTHPGTAEFDGGALRRHQPRFHGQAPHTTRPRAAAGLAVGEQARAFGGELSSAGQMANRARRPGRRVRRRGCWLEREPVPPTEGRARPGCGRAGTATRPDIAVTRIASTRWPSTAARPRVQARWLRRPAEENGASRTVTSPTVPIDWARSASPPSVISNAQVWGGEPDGLHHGRSSRGGLRLARRRRMNRGEFRGRGRHPGGVIDPPAIPRGRALGRLAPRAAHRSGGGGVGSHAPPSRSPPPLRRRVRTPRHSRCGTHPPGAAIVGAARDAEGPTCSSSSSLPGTGGTGSLPLAFVNKTYS